MSAYDKLADVLSARDQESWKVSFAELERLIGAKLPASAFKYAAWWSNNPSNNSMTKIWLRAGWRTERVDVPGRTVVFRRVEDREEMRAAGFADRGRGYQAASMRAPETKSFDIRRTGGGLEEAFRRRLYRMLDKRGLTVNALAARAGVPEKTIRAILEGADCARLATVDKLAKGLGVTPLILLDDDAPFEDASGAAAREATFEKKHGRKVRFEDLYGCMKGTIKIMPGVDLTEPVYTDKEWAEIEAESDRKWEEWLKPPPTEKERP